MALTGGIGKKVEVKVDCLHLASALDVACEKLTLPKPSGYFEEAYPLTEDPDPHVALIAYSAYRLSCEEYRLKQRKPEYGFSLLYFWQSCVRLWFLNHPGITPTPETRYPYPFDAIKVVNWSSQDSPENAAVNQFVELIKSDSTPHGEEFDLGYAVAIVEQLFDSQGDLVRPVERKVISYEEWLSAW